MKALEERSTGTLKWKDQAGSMTTGGTTRLTVTADVMEYEVHRVTCELFLKNKQTKKESER